MYAKSFHHSVGFRYAPVAHDPADHMHGLGNQGYEIPKRVVGRGCLRHFVVLFGFYCMNEVWKFHCVLDGEYRNIVSNQIENSFIGVEFHCKSPNISCKVGRSSGSRHGRETNKYGSGSGGICKDSRLGELLLTFIKLKNAVGGASACMYDTFRYALVVEMRDFFPEDKIFKQRRTALARF